MAKSKPIVSISEPFTLKGYWFVPGKQERKVAGVLTYTPGEKPLLELIGGFDEEPNPMKRCINSQNKATIPVIHGLTADCQEVTLLGCHVFASHNLSCPFSMESYKCGVLIYGRYINNADDRWISKAFVELPTIESFLLYKPFYLSYEKQGVINLITTPKDYDSCENTVEVEGVSCCLSNNVSLDINNHNATFTTCPILHIKSDNTFLISKLYRVLSRYSEFLSIASLTPTYSTNISVHCPDEYQDIKENRLYHSIKIVLSQNTYAEPPHASDVLLRYAHIKDIYPSIIAKWFEDDERMGPIKRHLIEVITNGHSYSSVTFLLMIQAIEGYYYRYVKDEKISLTKVLNTTIDSFSNVDAIRKIEWNVAALVASRHYYSHFVPKNKKPKTLYGTELAVAASELRILLICCMLRIIGFDNVRINDTLNKCSSDLVKPLELL